MIIDSQPAELFVDPDTSPLVANGTVSAFLPKDEQFLVSILKELPGVDVHSLPIQAAIQRMGNLLKEPF